MSHPGIAQSQVTGPSAPSVASGVSFANITTGVNTIATMTLGTGSNLTTSGTGSIHSAVLTGPTTLLGTPAAPTYFNFQNPTVATAVSAPNASPVLYFQENYWNGTASATDSWTIQSVMAASGTNPASYLEIQHPTGSLGADFVIVPNLLSQAVVNATTSFGVGNTIITSDFVGVDANDGLQCGTGDCLQMFSYWPILVYGNRETGPPTLVTGFAGTSMIVYAGAGTQATVSICGIGTTEGTSAPTHPGILRIIDGDVAGENSANPCGIEWMASSFASGYGWKACTDDQGGGVVTLNFGYRAGVAAWTNGVQFDMSGNIHAAAAYYSQGQIGTTHANAVPANLTVFGGLVTVFNTCDERSKEDITPFTDKGLPEILKLNPVSWHWKDEKSKTPYKWYGLTAQDCVAAGLPEAAPVMADGMHDFHPSAVIATLVNAVKELAAEVADLKAQIIQR